MNPGNQGFAHLQRLAEQRLAHLHANQRYRSLRARDDSYINLSTNDYLGLAHWDWFQTTVLERCRSLPVGAAGSRLLGGEHEIFTDLETRFALFKGSDSALLFPSGYHANEGIITALAQLAGEALEIFSDQLNHASLIDGVRLTGLGRQKRHIFAHNDLTDLERRLAPSTAPIKVVLTESVFSMDGDRANLPALQEVCQLHNATLIVDEAHAVYCYDHSDPLGGRGLADGSLISVNPCGKALGAGGAILACPKWLRELLINTSRPFIYSTAPSPWLATAVQVALEHDHAMRSRRRRLHDHSKRLQQALCDLEFDTGTSTSAIIPVIAHSDERAIQWSRFLEQRGILARPIRPPTVPEGTARLRLSLSAGLSDPELERVIAAFAALRHCA